MRLFANAFKNCTYNEQSIAPVLHTQRSHIIIHAGLESDMPLSIQTKSPGVTDPHRVASLSLMDLNRIALCSHGCKKGQNLPVLCHVLNAPQGLHQILGKFLVQKTCFHSVVLFRRLLPSMVRTHTRLLCLKVELKVSEAMKPF